MRYLKLLLCAALCCIVFIGCERGETVKAPTAYDNAMADGKICILLDAGHGITDVGAVNEENLGEITEADINFAITSLLYDKLTERGYEVIMSHDGKTPKIADYDDGEAKYTPSERAAFSNSTDADIFISIHCDSYPANPDVFGTRLYYPMGTANSSKFDELLSYALGDKINQSFGDYKEVIQKPMSSGDAYTVLYKTAIPSVLVECGFITNKNDAEKLKDAMWQDSFANALANGIDKYFEH